MKKGIFCTGLLLLLGCALMVGCDGMNCGSGTSTYPDVQGVSGMPVRLELVNGTLSTIETAVRDTLRFDVMGLQLTTEKRWLSLRKKAATSILPIAYACDPVPPEFRERLAGVYVFSDTDYDAFSPAGDTLNPVFDVMFTSFAEENLRPTDLTTFLASQPLVKDVLYLRPKSPPAHAGTHRFTVHFYLTNGEFYEVVLDPVTIGV
ncbi:hypothetical protein SAMN05421823_108188 [Catalinimonas alkaloidigena]|uniref:DUF5034 domain-containing protein n=1 Tax=Catalinimonas alkaloidigena TaxID=1075417 RepID=A0A1G9N5M8_9BACT|nr:hypothetical protein [Catalinimonas alkaloidigena]SDL81819.1 hypothetical protein SAMN05421823_108188 [Catalinimonas alkaloidigena]